MLYVIFIVAYRVKSHMGSISNLDTNGESFLDLTNR